MDDDMDLVEYITWVFSRLPRINDKVDAKCTHNSILRCFEDGFTKEDCLKYEKFSEHVNPHLSEEYACKEMGKIFRKYHPDWPKISLVIRHDVSPGMV